jgi:hypothetical protein
VVPAAAAAEADDEAEQGERGRRGASGDEDPCTEAEDGGALREPGVRDADAQHGRRRGALLLVLRVEVVARRGRGPGVALRGAARHGPRDGRGWRPRRSSHGCVPTLSRGSSQFWFGCLFKVGFSFLVIKGLVLVFCGVAACVVDGTRTWGFVLTK